MIKECNKCGAKYIINGWEPMLEGPLCAACSRKRADLRDLREAKEALDKLESRGSDVK